MCVPIKIRHAKSSQLNTITYNQEYSRAQPLIFLFFPVFFPFIIWFRARHNAEHKIALDVLASEEGADLGSQVTERDKLITGVCDRYTYGCVTQVGDDGERQGFEKRIKFQKQKSVLLRLAGRVKSRGKTGEEKE